MDTMRPRILFVDDSRLMRTCAEKILGRGFDLITAESAEQAWEQLQQDDSIEMLFTDLHMKGQNGYELLRQVRNSERPQLTDLPVVLITGAEDGETKRTHALTLGATDFITKPFQASELQARAKAYSCSRQSNQRLRLLEQEHHLDSVTGLGNRHYCEQRLTQAMSFAHRHQQSLGLMHLRLDGLQGLLDDLGEPYAGRALKRIGDTLAGRIRNEDMVFRTGPETFSFILPATDADGARTLQDRFLPDLDQLGLQSEENLLAIEPRFTIQQPIPGQRFDARAIVNEGLAERGITAPATPASANVTPIRERVPDIEEALAMLEAGKTEEVRRFLPKLEARLQSLLALIESERSAMRPAAVHNNHVWQLD